MLRSLARVVLLLVALCFGFLMVVACLWAFAPGVAPHFMHELGFPAPPRQFMLFQRVWQLTMIVAPVFVLGFLCCLVLIAWRVLVRGPARSGGSAGIEEGRMMQELYKELSRVEERVEALETILLSSRRARTARRGTE